MDPIAHTFTGMALAAAGLRRATPLATAAVLIGVNAPDVDVFSGAFGSYAPIAFRRGWTHGLLAIAVWPFVIAGALLVYDRYVRRRRDPAAPAARAGPLLAVTALGVATHPALDLLNNYGLRWLMPFVGRWFYGDGVCPGDMPRSDRRAAPPVPVLRLHRGERASADFQPFVPADRRSARRGK